MFTNKELTKTLLGDLEKRWHPVNHEESVFLLCKRPLERYLTCKVFVQRVDEDTYKAKVANTPEGEARDSLQVEETQLAHCATALYLLMKSSDDGGTD